MMNIKEEEKVKYYDIPPPKGFMDKVTGGIKNCLRSCGILSKPTKEELALERKKERFTVVLQRMEQAMDIFLLLDESGD